MHVHTHVCVQQIHNRTNTNAPHKRLVIPHATQTADDLTHTTAQSLQNLTRRLLPTHWLPPQLPVLTSSKAGLLIEGETGHLGHLHTAAACGGLQHHTFLRSPAAAESRLPHGGSTAQTGLTTLQWHGVLPQCSAATGSMPEEVWQCCNLPASRRLNVHFKQGYGLSSRG